MRAGLQNEKSSLSGLIYQLHKKIYIFHSDWNSFDMIISVRII